MKSSELAPASPSFNVAAGPLRLAGVDDRRG